LKMCSFLHNDFVISDILDKDKAILYRNHRIGLRVSRLSSVSTEPERGTVTDMLSIIRANFDEIATVNATTIYSTDATLQRLNECDQCEYVFIDCSNLYDSTELKRSEIRNHNQTQNKSVVARYTSQEKNKDRISIHTTVRGSITKNTRIILQLNSMLAHVVQDEKWQSDCKYRTNVQLFNKCVKSQCITKELYLNYMLVQAKSKNRYFEMGFVKSLSEEITGIVNDDDQGPEILYPHYSVAKKLPLPLSAREREYMIYHHILYCEVPSDLRVITSEITGSRTSVQSLWVRVNDTHTINAYVKCGIKLIDTGIEAVIVPKVNRNMGQVWVQGDPDSDDFTRIDCQDKQELYDIFRRNIQKQKHNHLGTIVLSEGEFLYMKICNRNKTDGNLVTTIDGVNWISIATKDIKALNDSWAHVPFKYIDNLSSMSYVMLSKEEIYVPVQQHNYPPVSIEEDEHNRRGIKKLIGGETRFRRGKVGVPDRTDYGKNKQEMGNSVPCRIQYSEEHLGIMPIHHEDTDTTVLLDSEIVGMISQLETAVGRLASANRDQNKRRNPESPQPSRPHKQSRVQSNEVLASFANMYL